jgi:hypothetical protein
MAVNKRAHRPHPHFGKVECRDRGVQGPGSGSGSVGDYLHDEVGVEGDADPFQ